MNKVFVFILIAALGCATPRQSVGPIRLIVTKVKTVGSQHKVYARASYWVYLATFDNLPDSIKPGTIITVTPLNRKDTTCKCFFTRIK